MITYNVGKHTNGRLGYHINHIKNLLKTKFFENINHYIKFYIKFKMFC